MSINVGLDSIVKKEMGDMISAHSLDLVVIGGNEVLLKSSTYVMDVVADRNGVSVVYFDTMQKPVKGYNVFLFLANKRRGQLALTKAGQDILIGSKDWMREYSWPTVHLGDDIAAMI
jgi:hypothetical protein